MKTLAGFLALLVMVAGSALAEDTDEKKDPLTTAQALQLGEEKLTEYTGLSEVGQDEAAELFATAKRLTTEQALGEKNLQLVAELQNWREAITKCRGNVISLAYAINGGGTMYIHAERRDISAVETFLTELAKTLPLAEGKGDERAASVIDRAIAICKGLKAPKDQKSGLAEGIKEATESFTSLKYKTAGIPAADAKKIVMFATDGIGGWLLNDDDRADKFEEFRKPLGQ